MNKKTRTYIDERIDTLNKIISIAEEALDNLKNHADTDRYLNITKEEWTKDLLIRQTQKEELGAMIIYFKSMSLVQDKIKVLTSSILITILVELVKQRRIK